MSLYEKYENPLITRYAGAEMSSLFSERNRIGLFRRLWIALAESQRELGLNITEEQIGEMKKYAGDIDFERAAKLEKKVRHDVMAHVHAFGEQAKSAMPIIHLGATSCFVTDNADLIIYRDALKLTARKILNVINNLRNFAVKYKDMPTLVYASSAGAAYHCGKEGLSLALRAFARLLRDRARYRGHDASRCQGYYGYSSLLSFALLRRR